MNDGIARLFPAGALRIMNDGDCRFIQDPASGSMHAKTLRSATTQWTRQGMLSLPKKIAIAGAQWSMIGAKHDKN